MADDFDVEEMLEAPFKKETVEEEVSLQRSRRLDKTINRKNTYY